MKYFTQETTRKNYGKLYRFLMIAMLVMCGGMVMGQTNTWTPESNTSATYILRSSGSTGNNFDVYQADGTTPVGSDYTHIYGRVNFTQNTKVTIIFENERTILFNGQFDFVGDGSSLTLQLGNISANANIAHSADNPTLKIIGNDGYNYQKVAFFLRPTSSNDVSDRQLIIQGHNPTGSETYPTSYDFANNFVIDGDGPTLTIDTTNSGTPMRPYVTATSPGTIKDYGLFRLQQGSLTLKNVTVQNFSTSWSNGGMAQVFTNNATAGVDLLFEHCYFTNIGASSSSGSPVLRMQGGGGTNANRNAILKNCKIENSFGSRELAVGQTVAINNANATIRTLGNNKVPLTIEGCHLAHNYGCPVRWHGCGSSQKMTVKDCLIKNNFTWVETNVNGGGGLLLKGPAQIQNCTIRNNRTNGSGGGIYLSTYTDFNSGTPDLIPEHSILKLDSQTKIYGNIAQQNGGGVAIEAKRMYNNNYYQTTYLYNTYGYIYWTAKPDGSPNEPFRVEFQQNGGKVYDNTANNGYGGGVFINRESQCTYYGVVCKLDYGEITGNTAANGGGVAIVTTDNEHVNNPNNIPTNVYPQDVIVEVSGASLNQQMLIQGNTARANGGGIYVEAYPLTYNNTTSTVTTNVLDYTLIDNNTAATHGGGLFVQSGTVGILKNNENGSHKPTFTQNKATGSNGGGVYLYDGFVNMKGAIIGGSTSTDGNTAGTSGGGIFVNTGSVNMVSSVVKYNQATAGDGGGIFVNTGDVFINRTEQGGITPSQITDNQAHNGGGIYNHAGSILAFGTLGGGENLHVQINNNHATAGSGGGIFCTGDATTTSYDIRLRRVDIKSNTATENGGGIYLGQGKISVVNGIIDDNSASGNGGGVYTHQGNIDINPTGDERNATRITNNTAAGNGGGLNTHSGLITVKGKDANQRIIVSGNKAGHGSNAKGSGGGVFCMGLDGNTEYITMRHVDLINNRANGDGTEVSNVTTGCGGGMYLQQGRIGVTDVKIQNNLAQYNGGGINNHSGSIDVDGCIVGGSQYYNSSYSINANGVVSGTAGGNKADNSGGGIYTRLGDIDIEDYMETSGNITRIESKVTYNEAAKNGGGIDTREGIIYINKKEEDDQIEVAFNKAERGGGLYANAGTIVAYNALIHDNTATLHGGGANNHSGDIILYGGMLSNNTAKEGHGGGAYTNVGDIDLFQFPSTNLNPTLNHGTKVYNNIAKLNGGAFNNHTGRVDVRHATIYNNTATLGNGGAIYCEGPHTNVDHSLGYTIRLLCSDMVQNKTRGQDGTATDPTGRGGGIYLKYGSIYAHYSNIRDNEANIAGGGLNNHEGNILLYGCDITGNRALELDGGGIFIKSGSITTGPSTVREAEPTSAKATIVQNNTAYRNGGGIINLHGDITLNGDLIGGATSNLGNKALTGNGGGVYIANGKINMKGGQIDNNTAENGKGGGVYSGGGEFNIGEREENPSPIVLLVDTEVKRVEGGQTATVHYHLVDQGKYGNDVSNVAHGIIWGKGTSNQPTTETEVVYHTTTGYDYVQGEPACERIIIPSSMITAGTTYYAKAFYRYTTGGNVIKGYSQPMEFVTFSDSQPLVISGSVSNITKNSAQGSGRVMDNGGGYNITERGVEIRRDKIGGETTAPAPIKIPASETTEFFTVSNLRDPSYPTDNVSLIPNTTYYAKAYATNSNGQTGYGNEVEFTTLKDTPDMGDGLVSVTTSIENGVIVARASFTMPAGTTFGTGANDVKAYGFVWSRDDDPELVSDHTIAGTLTTGTTTFTATYTGVTPGITFYVRAYASTIESEVNSSSDITKYSLSAATQHVAPMLNNSPVVRAIEISGITQTSATITCQIYSGYQAGTTQYGVHLENDDTYHSSNNYNSSTGTYTVELTGLTPGTTYYLKAYATNDGGTHYNYGNSYNFTALPIIQPNVVITSVDNIQKTSATINCSVENGGGSITAYGVKWGTSASALNQSIDYNNTQTGYTAPNGSFTQALSGLTAHTTYYVQAYATNSAGTHTCQKVSFTTDYDHPSVAFTDNGTIIPISGVDFAITGQNSYQYTAVGNYTVTPNTTSGEPVKTHGVCWSIFHDPTRRHSDVSDSHYEETAITDPSNYITSRSNCNQTFHPAYPNTKYYVHAYVSTSTPNANGELADIVYDPAGSNITFVSLPIVHTGGATAITNSSASLTVNINSPDREHHLRKYGVCWTESTTVDPTRAEGYYVEGDITAANPTGVSYNLTANVGADEGTSKTYRYRAYCINENSEAQGNIAYGDIKVFTTTQYTITATALPATAGTVSGGGGFNSGASCTLTASQPSSSDYTFEGWFAQNETTALTPNLSYTFDVSGSASYEARYNSKVTLTAGEGGQVSFDGNTWSTTTVNSMYGYNASITARAQVSTTGYDFVNWTDANGNEVSTSANYTFNVTDAISLTANFVSNRRSTSMNTSPRPRDIYPAPAREPWAWEEDIVDCHAPLAMIETTDTIVPTRATPVAPVNKPSINNNSAEYGGGVYVEHNANNPAKIVFAGGSTTTTTGTINENTASEAGGGIYISQGASMQMKGHCQVNSNHVPAGKKGGGIYLDGTLLVGNQATDLANAHALQVNLNWIGDGAYDANTRNNVYLPTDPILTGDALHKMRVITLLSDISGVTNGGKDGVTGTKIGLSVDRGFREVIYADRTTHEERDLWLSRLIPEGSLNGAIFDDANKYYALHVSQSDGMFDQDYDYLWGCWTSVVTTDPNHGEQGSPHYTIEGSGSTATWHIKTEEGLAWFSSIVNGLNKGNAAPSNTNSGPVTTLNAVIENDLDMSKYFWVPLGSVQSATSSGQTIVFDDGGEYNGTFDGQGHVIKGLICTYMTGIFKYGLFGTVGDNGVVKNTFVDDYRFTTYKQKRETSQGSGQYEDYNPTYYMGGIAAQVTGSGIIKNCEARGEMKTPLCDAENTCVGGLVGLINSTTGTEVHSSMAMPEIVGTTIGSTVNPFTAKNVGGLVGKINANNMLKNSFANVKLGTIANTVNVGGLVGNNLGTVENCYARLQNTYTTQNPAPSNFYWFAGSNTGSITYCYAPDRSDCTSIAYVPTGTTANPTGHGKYTATVRISGKYGFKHRDHQLAPASLSKDAPTTYISNENNNTLSGGLMTSLNAWVAANTGYSVWTRTMASPINDDYPILKFADFNAVGSEDSIYMLYNTDVNPMITAFNDVDATKHPTPSVYLYDENPTTLNVTNRDNVMLAINEDVGILQSVPLKARVGVTIRNTRKDANDYTDDPNWHLFSSAIVNVPMGLEYHTSEASNSSYVTDIVSKDSHPESVWGNRDQFDPPKTTWSTTPGHIGYFPTNTPYGTWRPGTNGGQSAAAVGGFFDLFDYSEKYYHWMNYKREGSATIQDHWHYDKDAADGKHYKISSDYRNDVTMPAGKGYLMALSGESMMMADGTLNTGEISHTVTKTAVGTNLPPHGHGSYAYDEPYRSLNIAGNPYQSYLDFYKFVFNTEANNRSLLFSDNGTTYSYATRSADGRTYEYFTITQSDNPATAGPYLHPHQGFFVKVTGNGDLNFNDNMRVAGTSTSLNSPYRDRLNYPLVNLFCYDANGKRDYTTVEISRPEAGGGHKMENLCMSDAQIYARYNDDNYQILFAPEGVNVVPVRCKVIEDGYFTMRWSTYHGDFSYLHLIDNLTGADVDCLTTDEYKFEGKASDYNSRFKLVFDCTGIDEPETPEPDEGATVFAFQMGDELIVNGEGVLQMFDLNGRCLMTRQAVGQQSSVSLPQVAAGMYLLRLTSNKQVRVQKMVIK